MSELLAAIRRMPLRERQIVYWFSESLSSISLPTLASHNPASRLALIKDAIHLWENDEFITHCLIHLSQSGLSMSLERVHRFCAVMASYAVLLERICQCPIALNATPRCATSTPASGKSAKPAAADSVAEDAISDDTGSTATTASGPKP